MLSNNKIKMSAFYAAIFNTIAYVIGLYILDTSLRYLEFTFYFKPVLK